MVGRLPDDGGDLMGDLDGVGEVDEEAGDGGDGDALAVGAVSGVDAVRLRWYLVPWGA